MMPSSSKRVAERIYRVERIWIVEPEDISVLDATATRSLTLVTCYPFYHVGLARNVSSSAPCRQTRLPFPRIVERVS